MPISKHFSFRLGGKQNPEDVEIIMWLNKKMQRGVEVTSIIRKALRRMMKIEFHRRDQRGKHIPES